MKNLEKVIILILLLASISLGAINYARMVTIHSVNLKYYTWIDTLKAEETDTLSIAEIGHAKGIFTWYVTLTTIAGTPDSTTLDYRNCDLDLNPAIETGVSTWNSVFSDETFTSGSPEYKGMNPDYMTAIQPRIAHADETGNTDTLMYEVTLLYQ